MSPIRSHQLQHYTTCHPDPACGRQAEWHGFFLAPPYSAPGHGAEGYLFDPSAGTTDALIRSWLRRSWT